jgi:predicted DNA-binding antitoxin AbrB/MazE fold protein
MASAMSHELTRLHFNVFCNRNDLYSLLSNMTIKVGAVYEHGIIRPLQPLQLAEGTRLALILVTHEQHRGSRNAAEILAEIAALPVEAPNEFFAGREHDLSLYPVEVPQR